MRILLDTNIIIYREKDAVLNQSIGNLYYWLDTLKHTKIIHPLSVQEIEKYKNENELANFKVKLASYEILKSIATPPPDFLSMIADLTNNKNDEIDNILLYEVFLGKVDLLLTEDRKMHLKAARLNISEKVQTIDRFISEATYYNPKQIYYKMLAVKQTVFGKVDLSNPFFDSFKQYYQGFEKWFYKKCDEPAYICLSEINSILGFLYFKLEDEKELYSDILPIFASKKRLKIGTFKVESTGFRLGERFIKIIFDHAIQYNVDEIYVTIFRESTELIALYNLFLRWGFVEWGTKTTKSGTEMVLVKKMNYDNQKNVMANFPNINYNVQKLILPIKSDFHTKLLPDSKLNNENESDFLTNSAYSYSLQKVFITKADFKEVKHSDIILFYRMGEEGTYKRFTSVLTTIGVVDEFIKYFVNKNDFMKQCQNRSVFTNEELEKLWAYYKNNICVLKFIYVKSLEKKLTLDYLRTKGIVGINEGPRPFSSISDAQFNIILRDSNTQIKFS